MQLFTLKKHALVFLRVRRSDEGRTSPGGADTVFRPQEEMSLVQEPVDPV